MPMIIHESLSRYPGQTSLPTSVFMIATKIPMMIMPILIGALAAATTLRSALLISCGLSVAGSVFSLLAHITKKRMAAE